MNERINNICKVEVARISEVISYYETPTGLAMISAPWALVPIAGNARVNINKENTRSGDRFDIAFSSNLKSSFQVNELCLIRITFADDRDPLLIGSPDFPVKLREDHSLDAKRLDFSTSFWRYPFRAQDPPSDPGSGSV
jgi:hypothetical protein